MIYLNYWLFFTIYYSFVNCDLNCLILFGDSLSDTGNLSRLTYGILPGPRYFKGRFSNGKIWPDFIQTKFKIQTVENYAFGAATSDNSLTSILKLIPSVGDQVQKYALRAEKSCGKNKDNYVVSYFGGTNDYTNITTNPFRVIENIKRDLVKLVEDYQFEQIMVVNIPPVYLSPKVLMKDKHEIELYKLRIRVHNTLLNELVEKLSNRYINVNFNVMKFEKDFSQLSPWYKKPFPNGELDQFCFHEEEDADPCINSEDFFFYDTIHPSTEVHKALAELISYTLVNHIPQLCPNHSHSKLLVNNVLTDLD